jgi:hypothetical protein
VQITKFSLLATLAVSGFAIGLSSAGPAPADCTNAGGVEVCAQGDSSGSDSGSSAGMYMPYACEYDWYCDDSGMSIMFANKDNSALLPPNTGGLNESRTGLPGGSYGEPG